MANKASISKVLSENLGITLAESSLITNSFLKIIKNNSFQKRIKLSGFGTFFVHRSPKRMGRNPKTKESYIIGARKKLNFKASNKIKEILN
tara:strand:+ start:5934 stop:6206 length:273 start_codon:yes stop_codon:yes gene_type:complete